MVVVEYKEGTISQILASQANGNGSPKKSKKAAKLQALFAKPSSSSSQQQPSVYRSMKVADSQFSKKVTNEAKATLEPKVERKKKAKKVNRKDELKLRNGDGEGVPKTEGEDADLRARKKKPKQSKGAVTTASDNGYPEGENTTSSKKKKKKKVKQLGNPQENGISGKGSSVSLEKNQFGNSQQNGDNTPAVPGKPSGNKPNKKRKNKLDIARESPSDTSAPPKKKKKTKPVTQGDDGATVTEETPRRKKHKLSKNKRDKLRKMRQLEKEQKLKKAKKESESGNESDDTVEIKQEDYIEDTKLKIKEEIESNDETEVKIKEEIEGGSKKKKIKQEVKEEVEENAAQSKTFEEMNAPKPKNAELEARTIFVGNIPQGIERKNIKKIFKKFGGSLETVRFRGVAPNKPTTLKKVAIFKQEHHPDKSTFSAYLRYSSREEAKDIVEKARGMILKDHHLIVDLAVPEKRKNVYQKSIFVGNLDFKITEDELWQFFEDCGEIDSVRIVRDNSTGLGKGFGYVNFIDEAALTKAMRKANQPLRNRPIRIRKCIKKEKVAKNLTDDKMRSKYTGRPTPIKVEKDFEIHSRKDKKVDVGKSFKRIEKKSSSAASNKTSYAGDKLAEIGKLKRKSNKPNRDELRKKKITKILANKNNPKASG